MSSIILNRGHLDPESGLSGPFDVVCDAYPYFNVFAVLNPFPAINYRLGKEKKKRIFLVTQLKNNSSEFQRQVFWTPKSLFVLLCHDLSFLTDRGVVNIMLPLTAEPLRLGGNTYLGTQH